MIKIPHKIPQSLKTTIKNAFINAIKEVGDEEAFYVHNKLERKLKTLRKYPGTWHADMANVAEELCNLYIESLHNPRRLLNQHKKAILAALFYLCNPYDIIPDYIPGKGYMDDAYVFNLCVSQIKKAYPKDYERISKAVQGARK